MPKISRTGNFKYPGLVEKSEFLSLLNVFHLMKFSQLHPFSFAFRHGGRHTGSSRENNMASGDSEGNDNQEGKRAIFSSTHKGYVHHYTTDGSHSTTHYK